MTRKDTFPLPHIDDLLDQLGQSKYSSTLDLAAGYWQIQVAPESQFKTAILLHHGISCHAIWPDECTSCISMPCPRGSRVVESPDFVLAYIDDILRRLKNTMKHLRLVIECVSNAGL